MILRLSVRISKELMSEISKCIDSPNTQWACSPSLQPYALERRIPPSLKLSVSAIIDDASLKHSGELLRQLPSVYLWLIPLNISSSDDTRPGKISWRDLVRYYPNLNYPTQHRSHELSIKIWGGAQDNHTSPSMPNAHHFACPHKFDSLIASTKSTIKH